MAKRKKALIAMAILLVMLLAFIGGQAYAKYVSQIRGNGIAQVATWSFKVNGQTEQVEEINLASTYDSKTLVNNKIAPGTTGSFNIIVDGTESDVGINYKVNLLEESNKPQNLKFIYEGKEYDSIKSLGDNLSGNIAADEKQKAKTLNIKWKWDYETGSDESQINLNDIKDTNDAKNIESYTFQVVVTGTQVEPQV